MGLVFLVGEVKPTFPLCCFSSWQVHISSSPQPRNCQKFICCTVNVLLEGRRAKCFLTITDLLPLSSKTGHSIDPITWAWSTATLTMHKGRFSGCMVLLGPQCLPGCAISFTLVPGFSECLLQGGERELCWRGDSHSLPPRPVWNGFSCCCHGNGAWSHRRGNMCGIQQLPGVGRREPSFYPVQVPTGGRYVRFKMRGAGERIVWL